MMWCVAGIGYTVHENQHPYMRGKDCVGDQEFTLHGLLLKDEEFFWWKTVPQYLQSQPSLFCEGGEYA